MPRFNRSASCVVRSAGLSSPKNSTHELESLTRERSDLRNERERLKEEVALAEASAEEQQAANESVSHRRDELIRAVGEASRELAAYEGERRSRWSWFTRQPSEQATNERTGGGTQAERRTACRGGVVDCQAPRREPCSFGGSRQRVQEVEKELVPGRDEVIQLDEQDRAVREERSQQAFLLVSERECLEAEPGSAPGR